MRIVPPRVVESGGFYLGRLEMTVTSIFKKLGLPTPLLWWSCPPPSSDSHVTVMNARAVLQLWGRTRFFVVVYSQSVVDHYFCKIQQQMNRQMRFKKQWHSEYTSIYHRLGCHSCVSKHFLQFLNLPHCRSVMYSSQTGTSPWPLHEVALLSVLVFADNCNPDLLSDSPSTFHSSPLIEGTLIPSILPSYWPTICWSSHHLFPNICLPSLSIVGPIANHLNYSLAYPLRSLVPFSCPRIC